VICFTLGPYSLDERTARELAQALVAIRDGEMPDPSGGRIAAQLHDQASSFYEELPPALGQYAFWATTYVDPDRLPNGCLPEDAVLPALVHPPEKYIELIPASLWA
jgi:hypothetical protein